MIDTFVFVLAAGGAEEILRRDAAAAEIAVGGAHRSSSRGTLGQRAGNAKGTAERVLREGRSRVHQVRDTARSGGGKAACFRDVS